MIPIRTKNTTNVLENAHGGTSPLPVTAFELDGTITIASSWIPQIEELKTINSGPFTVQVVVAKESNGLSFIVKIVPVETYT